MTRTFLAELVFDGREFAGWQRQPNERTVQQELERVLERLAGGQIVAHAAGRTDAGVHSEGLAVSFTFPAQWQEARLSAALNALLPEDCWVRTLRPVPAGFHARKSALHRRYRYVVGTDAAARSPFRHPYEWALCRPLNGELLTHAADQIAGTHDFEAFSVRGQQKSHHRCTVHLARWVERPAGAGFDFHVAADRFLHHMVRMLVGTMVDIAQERRPPGDMVRLLELRDNQQTSAPAPPQGLYFVRAEYPASALAAPTEDAP